MNTLRISKKRLMYPLLCGVAIPSCVFAAIEFDTGNIGSFLVEPVMFAILSSTICLLLGFLILLRRMRKALDITSTHLKKGTRNIEMMGDHLETITFFQLACSKDGQFGFTYLSHGFEQTLSISRDRVMMDARLAFDHLYETDIPFLVDAYREAKESLAPNSLEIRALDNLGNLKWLHLSIVPVMDEENLLINGLIQDITESRRAEMAIAEEKRNFQNLFDSIDDFMIVCDMNGNILHTNPSVSRRLGYTPGELADMSLFELYAERMRDEAYQVVARMHSENNTTSNVPLQMESGEMVPVETSFFRGTWKQKQAVFGIARDVGTRVQVENALRESKKMLQMIIDTIPMSVFWKDKDSVYLGCNEAFIEDCNLNQLEDIVGKTPYDLFDMDTATNLVELDRQVIMSNSPTGNTRYSHAMGDGSVRWRETNLIPLQDNMERAVGVLGMWRDITAQKHSEERLKRTLDDMERFNQLMRGREKRTLELKAEINALLGELGQPPKYTTTTDSIAS